MHHLADLVKLLEQTVNLNNSRSRALGYTLNPGAADNLRMFTLIRRHRAYHCLDTLKRVIVYIYVLYCLTHSRNHRSKVFDVTHALDLVYLLKEIRKRKLILSQLLGKLFSLLLVVLLLGTFHKSNNIAHTQNTVGHTIRMENIDTVKTLARTYKLDRLVHNRSDRQCRTAASIAIQLSENHAIEIKTFIKSLCRIHRILTRHRVNDKQNLTGLH